MTYLHLHNYRLCFGITISIVVHIFAVIWLFYAQNNILYVENGIRSSDYSSLSINLNKKPASKPKPLIQKFEPVKENIVIEVEEIQEESEKVIEQIPVVQNAVFEGNRTPPTYPKRALRMHQEGVVLLKALVNEKGKIQNVIIIRSSGFNSLDKSAVNAVWNWKFRPTYINGKSVLSWVKVPVEFIIK